MSLHVEGQDCPVCGAHLFDDDDVVFCPICGAPHHRDCFNSVGHCALEAYHGTPQQYKRPSERGQTGPDAEGGIPRDRMGKTCPRCGKSCTSNTLFCPYCGQNLGGGPADSRGGQPFSNEGPEGHYGHEGGFPNGGPPPFGGYSPVMPQADPYGGVQPEEKIDGVPAKDVAKFVGSNTQRYLPKFKSLTGKSKSSWNWAAFLFPSGWLFFRKCYKPGLLVLLLSFASTMFSIPMQVFISSVAGALPTSATTADLYAALMQNLGNAGVFAWITQGASLLLSLGIRIVIGIWGDSIYKGHVISSILKIQKADDLLEDYDAALIHKGGVNPLMLLVAFLASQWCSYFILMFL